MDDDEHASEGAAGSARSPGPSGDLPSGDAAPGEGLPVEPDLRVPVTTSGPSSSAGPTAAAAAAPAGSGPNAAPTRSGPKHKRRKPRSSTRTAVEWGVTIGGALLLALVIRTFLLTTFYIPSASMEPTLTNGDRVVVNQLSYKLHDVGRGDIIVFERPPNDPGSIKDLIKRVVGLPGDTVEGRDGAVYINGERLEEDYLPSTTRTDPFPPVQVPADHVFVMGDNRGNSTDSRVFGPIEQSSIVGRAFIQIWPLSSIGLL